MLRALCGLTALLLLASGCRKNIPLPVVSAPRDEATVRRGEYLATHLCACVSCHSPRDWSRFSGPVDPARAWSGGENVGPREGLGASAIIHAPNLTPHRLREWTDGELVRAITTGMGKGEHPLFPTMPYVEYRALALDDALAIVAYLRTLEPLVAETPPRRLPFPLELVVNGIPRPVELRAKAPVPGDADYGSYVTRVGGCVWCHSAVDGRGRIEAGGEFIGGHAFNVPAPGGGQAFSANLTPDPETGLGAWTREVFVARFRGFDVAAAQATPLGAEAPNSLMAWTGYHDVSEQDLGAIYDYLRTLPPKKHLVVKFQPPPRP